MHLADLVAFVKPSDLPSSLTPFFPAQELKKCKGPDVRCIVLKIRGTVDSYYAMGAHIDTTVEQIETKLRQDLGVVRLTRRSQKQLKELCEELKQGKYAHFLNHRTDKKQHPYRH
jgi:hypothetical protein